MKSKIAEARRNSPSYKEMVERVHKQYEEAVASSTIYSKVISEYVQTFMSAEDISEKLRWNIFQLEGHWNPTMLDVVKIEELLDTTLVDILNWGKQMGYNV